MSKYLDTYLEGWRTGDSSLIVSACADDFVIDDPVDGHYTKAEFDKYYEIQPEGDIEFSDVVTEESDGRETQWGWFSLASETGASQLGTFMNKADGDGVHLTKIAYYSR